MVERRASRRYELSFPILVHATHLGESCTYAGRTRDLSTGGVHFVLDVRLNPGTAVEFTITMPAELTGGSYVFVRGAGRVLWVSDFRDGVYGMACSIEQYEITRDRSGLVPIDVDAL